jgi:hypothetical protein
MQTWGDTSVGESQWIANMKNMYGNGWRRIVDTKIRNAMTIFTKAPDVKTIKVVDNPAVASNYIPTTTYPWDRPVDNPLPNKKLITSLASCEKQVDYIKCNPSQRNYQISKEAYESYGIAQDGTSSKKIGMFDYICSDGNCTRRTQAEVDSLNIKMDKYCSDITENCKQRFSDLDTVPSTPGGGTSAKKELIPFMEKYKYPLIGAGVVLILIVLMKTNASSSPIIIR